jgi:hypothetical protein
VKSIANAEAMSSNDSPAAIPSPLKDTVGEFQRVSLAGINRYYIAQPMTTLTALEAAYVIAQISGLDHT